MPVLSTPRARAAPPTYAELQVTTNFSFLHGGSHPQELVAQAKALGLAAIAVTDRNTLAGAVRTHTAARQLGLPLIVGARLDLSPAGDGADEDGGPAPSLLCLPTDRAAYGRLSRLLTLGQLRTDKGEARLTLEDVVAHAEGQILVALPPDDWCWREVAAAADVTLPRETKEQHPATIIRLADACASRRGGRPSLASRLRRDGSGPMMGEGDGPSPRHDEAMLRMSGEGKSAFNRERSAGRARAPFEAVLGRLRRAVQGPLYLAASHRYRGDDRARIAALAALASRCGTPLVATNDVLYHAPQRRPLQDVLTCIREKTTIGEAGLHLEANAERHLKSPAEMSRLFAGHADAVARTAEILRACRFSLDELVYEYPDEPVPAGRTPQQHLEELTWQGARARFPGGVSDKVRHMLARELALIASLNYARYFLTVHDIVAFARSRGILCQGRGSAANSAVCYCLGVTAVNPTEVDLLFERFISSERKEPPDIDVDFEHERREEVIQHIYARYGRERAGLAATVISYRARSAVREVGKAMGLTEDTVAALAGMVWGTRAGVGKGGGVLPEKHVREAGLDPGDPLLARVLDLAAELSGFPRHLSQHVGGFVLTRSPLSEVVPIGNAAMPDRTFIEWDKDDLAALGLLKIDVLALGMLTCIRKGFELIEKHHGRPMSLARVPREDAAVYDMLCQADSIGVFQVESRAQMNMLPRLKPRTFYDLVIEVAIVRPGPIQGDMVHPYLRRRDGIEPEVYPAPDPAHGDRDELRQILGKTKGVPLFQEQAMRIAMDAARFSDAEVNELRKAMATFRRRGTIGLLEDKMVSRMTARGYERAFAERCFNQIKGFGEYGFPESHAASFAHLVYVSAWLKCHYPAAFACALLNSQPMGFYAPAQIVRDAREHGVEVLPVDVGHSDWDCTLEEGGSGQGTGGRVALRLGLRQVDGLAEEEARKIVTARNQGRRQTADGSRGGDGSEADAASFPVRPSGSSLPAAGCRQPAANIHDLHRRSGARIATLERLAAADAFRSLGLDRRQALWEVRALAGEAPLPLFAWGETRETGEEGPHLLPAMPLPEHVVNDYQTLRLSLKAHPVSFLRRRLERRRVVPCAALRGLADGALVTVAGVVLVRQRPGSAKGVVFMTLEDETGIANTVIWPKTLERFRKVIMGARLIEVRGRIQRHQDIIHVVSARLVDLSPWLHLLTEDGLDMPVPVAPADEVLRPDPGSARPGRDPPAAAPPASETATPPAVRAPPARHPRQARIMPPRETRIVPKSRDFH